MDFSKFHVVTVISNPIRYASRYELYKTFEEDIKRKGGRLWTVEVQTGARFHKITSSEDSSHIQLWSSSIPGELWLKESMINIAIQHITRQSPDWRYLAWVDADVRFEKGMIEDTVHQLQHYDLVQMWSHAIDLGPNNELVQTHESFLYCYVTGKQPSNITGAYSSKGQGHPGYAVAIRRDALNKIGGLIDFAILGSADRHILGALTGRVLDTVHGDMHPRYIELLKVYQERAEREIKRNVGYVSGTIRHSWHGKKAQRGYSSRWRILVENQFNPDTDIKKDVSGLWQLVVTNPRQLKLRDDIRRYFRARNEDSIDL